MERRWAALQVCALAMRVCGLVKRNAPARQRSERPASSMVAATVAVLALELAPVGRGVSAQVRRCRRRCHQG